MRTIGMDLGVSSSHTAIVADETGAFITPVLQLHTNATELEQLLARAAEGSSLEQLQVVMEPTGMAWFPLAVYLTRRGVTVYLVNAQQAAALRRFYSRYAKSDRVDARVLAKMPLVNGDQLHRLMLPSDRTQACQRACKQLDRLVSQITAIGNRMQDTDRFAWPGLQLSIFSGQLSPAARWFREHWYNPQRVVHAGVEAIRQDWRASGVNSTDPGDWADDLVEAATKVLLLYGDEGDYLDFDLLQAEVSREQDQLLYLETMAHTLRLKTVRPLYREIHPSRHLETIKGVGQDGAAVFASFIHDPARFPTTRSFRGWSGMIPSSKQSADSEAKGLRITQAGPNLIKKFAYVDAEVARRWDPQIAAIYYDQMVHKGKHHKQAICTCATHLLDRILAVLREDRPYELRDVDGTPVTDQQARAIIAQRYKVPESIRRRNNKRARRKRAEQRAERKQRVRESRPSS